MYISSSSNAIYYLINDTKQFLVIITSITIIILLNLLVLNDTYNNLATK